ncbi:hypothetical protein I4U23_023077 [Adineta vaga]|nr:hypothetical protein I4U23_023077 [Adineta vaga]
MRYLLSMFIVAILIIANFAAESNEQETAELLNVAINDQFETLYLEHPSSTQYRVKRARGGSRTRGGGKEHTNNARPSTKGKHEKGQTRKGNDRKGGEKGDARRPYGK